MEYQCREVRCFSCSDCANSTLALQKNFITTTRDSDQCMKTTIVTSGSGQGQRLINRGASSNCAQYSSEHVSIYCCNTDFCNA
ncbi:hypothetical protein I4U23_000555 [Adineta vaga]|nr:hypothetical protein I4U23_000555 [Adineta vaga]